MKKSFLLGLFLLPHLAMAQVPGDTDKKKEPVSIEASSQLEWLRDKNMYRATKDVVITQGDKIIKGDNAEAEYDPKIGQSAITVMTMTGHVEMTSQDRVITADRGVYDTRSQILTLTGNIVTLKTPTVTVTSQDGMTYDAAKGIATARGKAVASEIDKTIKAETITAYIDPKTSKLTKATASGNVLITHQGKDGTDIAQSKNATYDMAADIITLNGDVKLTRGNNHMQGDTATVDMKTGISNLKNNATQGGRVRAIFTPGDQSSPMPSVTGSLPIVRSKNEFQQPYAVKTKDRTTIDAQPTNVPRMPGR